MGEPDAFVGVTATGCRVEQCLSSDQDVCHKHTRPHSQSSITNGKDALGGDAQRAVVVMDDPDMKRRRLETGPVVPTSPPSTFSDAGSCDGIGTRRNGNKQHRSRARLLMNDEL